MVVTKAYVLYPVSDMDRAVAFYRDAFGLDVRVASPDWSELGWGDATVALHGGRGDGDPPAEGLGFEVDDLDGACAAVIGSGGVLVVAPAERPGEPIRLALAADPDGNRIHLAQST